MSVLVDLSEQVFGNRVGRQRSFVAVTVLNLVQARVEYWIVAMGDSNGFAVVVLQSFGDSSKFRVGPWPV